MPSLKLVEIGWKFAWGWHTQLEKMAICNNLGKILNYAQVAGESIFAY